MAVTDDITRLTAIIARMHQGGLAASLRQQRGLTASAVGKACGTTADVIMAWESGLAMPTTGEALAWLSVIYEQAGNPLVFAARSNAEEAGVQAAHQAELEQRRAAADASW